MKFDLVAPCKQCPFRTDIAPFITAARAREILTAITQGQQTFSCHKTVDYSGDGEGSSGEVHCAGALILLERIEKPNQMMRIAERVGFYDCTKLKMDAPVYATPASMIAAHRKVRAA